MFKNCCGCAGKQTKRDESEEDEDEEEKEKKERDNRINREIEEENEATAREIAQKEIAAEVRPKEPEVQRKSSLKKPKPRLSISTEVKIIPSNFPDGMPEFPDEAEEEAGEEKKEEEEEDEEPEDAPLPVKNIDGKIIKKSATDEDNGAEPSPQNATTPSDRPVSPLSDEVFVANEKSALHLPLHNLGVKIGSTQTTGHFLEIPVSPKNQASSTQTPNRGSMPAVLHKWLSEEEDEMSGTHEPPATPVSRGSPSLCFPAVLTDIFPFPGCQGRASTSKTQVLLRAVNRCTSCDRAQSSLRSVRTYR